MRIEKLKYCENRAWSRSVLCLLFVVPLVLACSKNEVAQNSQGTSVKPEISSLTVEPGFVAEVLANLQLGSEQLGEVYDAVKESSANGYDEEYTMGDLFRNPGTGVGTEKMKSKALTNMSTSSVVELSSLQPTTKSYANPMREVIKSYLEKSTYTRATSRGDSMSVDEYLEMLQSSDLQIYWPYSKNWDGQTYPIITFDPEFDTGANEGYKLVVDKSGNRTVKKVVVDEKTAMKYPVWVVNRNSDRNFTSLEVLRNNNPNWGSGGSLVIPGTASEKTRANAKEIRTLVIKDFCMKRNYDSWFAGASEFFIKCGSVEDFCAATEAEMKVYTPSITDVMIVVKRSQKGKTLPVNVVLVSEWTDQLSSCAFLVTEDDGGARKTWKCSTMVKIKSKSYGFDVSLPFNFYDDIVWRGSLTRSFVEKYSGKPVNFGDVAMTLELIL